MPAVREDDSTAPAGAVPSRRSVVPTAAGRSLWRAAVWTGAGAAVVCATLAIIAVAICWLPVSGSSGRSHSAIHAGLLTFLAALHGGITVDALSGTFLPLGLLVAVALAAWRAGVGLADAADDIDERDPLRLALAAGAQAVSFTVVCLVMVPFASLGTSNAPFLGVGIAALLLFALVGGTALALYSPLSDRLAEPIPAIVGRAARAAAAVVAIYLGAGALLVVGSLVVHHDRVQTLSTQVGGGWQGVPILLLGLLAAPNAAIAGASYLAGPGFAVGTGTASAFTTAHGTLPAFPILGAMPDGHGATTAVWVLMALTLLAAATALGRLAGREVSWSGRFQLIGVCALVLVPTLLVLGWQAGGGIGDAGLGTIGPSPWKFALALTAAVGALACAGLGLAAAAAHLRGGAETDGVIATGGADAQRTVRPTVLAVAEDRTDAGDARKGDQLAG
jgi:hypothetical protein